MKVKRFNNLWAMGLILCGVLLIAFYVAKIFFPEFIIGIAETPRLVEIGTYLIRIKGHLTCVKEPSTVWDIWDCRAKMCDLSWEIR